ncbi:MAG: AAA family ATPase [Cyanobacteria bacterium J06554_11]
MDALLIKNAKALQCRASQAAQLTQMSKLGGGLSLLGGVALCLATGSVGAAPLVLGGLLYTAATARELATTKALTPLPWAKIDVLAAFSAHRSGVGQPTVEVADYQHLSDEEKATYVLCTLLAPATAALLNDRSEDEQTVIFQDMRETLLRHYREMPFQLDDGTVATVNILDDPHRAARVLYGGPEGFLGQYQRTLPAQLARALPSDLTAQPQPMQLPVEPVAQIGAQTQLKAIEVDVEPSSDIPSISEFLGDTGATVAGLEDVWAESPSSYSVAIDLPTVKSTLIENPYNSTAIFGSQRTGKSYLAAVASRELNRARGTQVFHVNLASYGDEDELYWKHAKSIRADLSTTDTYTAERLIEAACKVIEEFYSTKNSLLVFDEFAYVGSKSNKHLEALQPLLMLVADKISTLASTGVKRQKAIWTIAPEFVAGQLVKDALAIKKLSLCLVGITPGRSIDWNGNRITFNQELYQQIGNNYPVSPPPSGFDCDRIAYIAGQWRPVGLTGDEL